MPKAKSVKSSKKSKKVSVPVAKSSIQNGKTPTIASGTGAKGSIHVRHRELFDIAKTAEYGELETGDPGANVYGWTVNPSNNTLFPWLSRIATNYDKYLIRSIKVLYVPRVSTATAGTIVLSYDPDARDPVPPSDLTGRQILLSHRVSSQGPCWSAQQLSIPLNQIYGGPASSRYVRDVWPVDPSDTRLIDAGNIWFGIFGSQAPVSSSSSAWVGDLLVEYDVELLLPQISTDLSVGSVVSQVVALPLADSTDHVLPWPIKNFPGLSANVYYAAPVNGTNIENAKPPVTIDNRDGFSSFKALEDITNSILRVTFTTVDHTEEPPYNVDSSTTWAKQGRFALAPLDELDQSKPPTERMLDRFPATVRIIPYAATAGQYLWKYVLTYAANSILRAGTRFLITSPGDSSSPVPMITDLAVETIKAIGAFLSDSSLSDTTESVELKCREIQTRLRQQQDRKLASIGVTAAQPFGNNHSPSKR